MPSIATKSRLVVFVGMATVMRREDIAKSAEKGRWTEVRLTPKGFMQLSDTSAVIAYDRTARRKDGEPHHALVSSGYIKRADGWKLATPTDRSSRQVLTSRGYTNYCALGDRPTPWALLLQGICSHSDGHPAAPGRPLDLFLQGISSGRPRAGANATRTAAGQARAEG